MFKSNKFKIIVASIITLLPLLAGFLLWDKLPDKVPMHWDINGQVDGYADKLQAIIFGPVLMFVLYWVCVLVTKLDPKNKGQNKKAFNMTIFIIPMISLAVNGLIYSAALGYGFNTSLFLCLLSGAMFVLIGNYMPKIKQNFTIGIKIPWTLDSEENWNATHRFTGKVWFIGGFLIMICAFLPATVATICMVTIIMVMAIIPFVYSYLYTKRK